MNTIIFPKADRLDIRVSRMILTDCAGDVLINVGSGKQKRRKTAP